MVSEALIAWLRDSDPALRWQVERDLVHEQPEVWETTRARIATTGFGPRLLALQDPDGQWAGGAFFPADFDFHGPEAADDAGQPWTATTGGRAIEVADSLRDASARLVGLPDSLGGR